MPVTCGGEGEYNCILYFWESHFQPFTKPVKREALKVTKSGTSSVLRVRTTEGTQVNVFFRAHVILDEEFTVIASL